MTTQDRMRAALEQWGPAVDAAVATGARSVLRARRPDWSDWEVQQGFDDLLKLSRGSDCAYDRPSIGASYALWYHGRRTQQALRALWPWFTGDRPPEQIVDLGCGTGATATAAYLLTAARRAVGAEPTPVRVLGVDGSPFMCEVAEEVFAALKHSRPMRALGQVPVRSDFVLDSWTRAPRHVRAGSGTLLFAGYLLDHSDHAHLRELAERFAQVADACNASRTVLMSAGSKAGSLDSILRALQSAGWRRSEPEKGPMVFSGELEACTQLRTQWYQEQAPEGLEKFRGPATWIGVEQNQVVQLERDAVARSTLFAVGGDGLLLDPEQDEAAQPEARLTIVVGAAGSGKSRVLAERIARTAETAAPSLAPRILVTAFNKPMVGLLADWVCERLGRAREVTRKGDDGWVEIEVTVNGQLVGIDFVNRDKIPTRVLGCPWNGNVPGWPSEIAKRRSDLANHFPESLIARVEPYLTPEFLDEELEQVIYARAAFDLDSYQAVDRVGRKRPIAKHSPVRHVIWHMVMAEPRPDSFVHRRISAYERFRTQIENQEQLPTEKRWSHVFVDECQDFTETDLRLLACLVHDPANLCAAGDETQSIHLGSSYRRPGLKNRRWKKWELVGSYRLPVRVCEALAPLARSLHVEHSSGGEQELDVVPPQTRKAATLGPRPIVVYGGASCVSHLTQVLNTYRPLLERDGVARVTVAEDRQLKDALAAIGWAGEIDYGSMRKIKGLERPCVIFSDKAKLPVDECVGEWVYTALTRATTLLVIVLHEEGDERISNAIAKLDPRRLLFWDNAAEQAFRRLMPAGAG